MNFDLTDEQRMLKDGALRYLRERYTLESRRAAAKTDAGISPAHWEQFAGFGWTALPVPEAHGGMGGNAVDIAVLMEQCGAALVAEPLIDSAVLCGTLLSHAEAGSAAATLLPGIAAGELIVALAHMEQDGRSEFETPVATRASRDDAGWRLDGVKQRVFHGAVAHHFVVSARTADGELALFAVPRASAGLALHGYELLDGTRAADLRLSAVTLPASALLCAGLAAEAALTHGCDAAILAMTAAAVGSMDAVMQMTAEYLKTRVQFGQPLARFQALQHRLSEMFVETDQSRSILCHALAAFESGEPAAISRAVSAAKTLVASAWRFVAGQGIQLHGGIGTTEEYAVGHHYRAMLVYEYRFGDSSFHLDRSAGLPARPL